MSEINSCIISSSTPIEFEQCLAKDKLLHNRFTCSKQTHVMNTYYSCVSLKL